MCVCVVYARPTKFVVTATIPATVFVYTELLTHPNNQPLWAFLIPTQSQRSQVELPTAAIRYSNTALIYQPLPLLPTPSVPFVSSTAILDMTQISTQYFCFYSICKAGQLNAYTYIYKFFFIFYHILPAQNKSQANLP